MSPAVAGTLGGLAIVAASMLTSELWWLGLRPKTYTVAMASWMLGILARVFITLAGLAICIRLLDLPAPPLVVAMAIGYVVALTLETRWTLRRLARLNK